MLEAAYMEEAADGGYFAALASARYLQVTTFGRGGRPVPARVRGVAGGGRFYFGARTWSGTVKRLRHADAVQVAPCGALGVCYGPPLDATARLLPAGEASRAAAELARKYPVRRGAAHLATARGRRPAMMYYELVPDEAGEDQDPYPRDRPAPVQRAGSWAARGKPRSRPCQIRRTHVTDHGAGSIASIWPVPVEAPAPPANGQSMPLDLGLPPIAEHRAARRSVRAAAPGGRRPAGPPRHSAGGEERAREQAGSRPEAAGDQRVPRMVFNGWRL